MLHIMSQICGSRTICKQLRYSWFSSLPKNKSYVRVTPVSNTLLFLERIQIYVCLLLFQKAGMLTASLHKLLLSLLYERELQNSFACRLSLFVSAECWIGAMFSHSFFSWNKLQTYVLLQIKILY